MNAKERKRHAQYLQLFARNLASCTEKEDKGGNTEMEIAAGLREKDLYILKVTLQIRRKILDIFRDSGGYLKNLGFFTRFFRM